MTLCIVVCLISFSFFILLPVSRAEILGNSEVFIKSGNDINLTCVALEAPSPPSFIYWYKGGSVINYSQRGGISVLTERQTKTSKLVIARAMSSDSGNYTCMPSNSGNLESCLHDDELSSCVNSKCTYILLIKS